MNNEIQQLLEQIKICINKKDSYIVFDVNNIICSKYSLSSKIIKKIIKSLTISNYVDSRENIYIFNFTTKLVDGNGSRNEINIGIDIKYIDKLNTIVIYNIYEINYNGGERYEKLL